MKNELINLPDGTRVEIKPSKEYERAAAVAHIGQAVCKLSLAFMHVPPEALVKCCEAIASLRTVMDSLKRTPDGVIDTYEMPYGPADFLHLLRQLLAGEMTHEDRAELMRKLGIADLKPSNPGRFTDCIKNLHRDLAVAVDAAEHGRIYQEILDAEDAYREYTGISRREAKMTEADLDRAAEDCGAEDEEENE